MRRVIGPIVTAVAALVVAGAVVANPIIPQHSDVRIPAVQLSAGSDPSGSEMLDAAFLAAIAPAPADSTSPLSVLKQLVSSIAANVTDFGRTAIVDAFVAGITAATQPELTAVSIPYLEIPYLEPPAGLPGTSAPAPALLPNPSPSDSTPSDAAQAAGLISDTTSRAVQQVAATLTATAYAVAAELSAVVHATGAVVASAPDLIVDTLRALANGDIGAALQNAVKAVALPLAPAMIVVGALRGFIANHLRRQSDADPSSSSATVAFRQVRASGTVQRSPAAARRVSSMPSHSAARRTAAPAPFAGRISSASDGRARPSGGDHRVQAVRAAANSR